MELFGVTITRMILIGNIFSLFASTFDCISTFSHRKEKMILWQQGYVISNGITNFILHSYSGMIINILGLFRNWLVITGRYTRRWMFVTLTALIVLGLAVNNRGWLGFLAVTASGQYTACLYYSKNAQQMRYALIINTLMWFLYDLMILSFPMAIMDLSVSCFCAYNTIRNRDDYRDKKS